MLRFSGDTIMDPEATAFLAMLDALPAAVYTTDAEGRLTYFNSACVELSGRVPNLGTDEWCVTWKLFHPDGTPLPHAECPMAVALKERRCVRGAQAIAERPDGSRVWFEPYPTPLFDSAGNLVGGINMLVDITDRKETDAARALLAAIVETSDDAIITKDLDGVITSWNQSAERLFGYRAEEAVGQPITILIPPERLQEEPEILSRLRRGERVDHFETVRVGKKGQRLDISLTISPVTDASGRIVGISKIARDITERKRAEAAIRDSENRFRVTADAAPAMLRLMASDGGSTFLSHGWYRFTGQSESTGLGLGWLDAVHPTDREGTQRAVHDAVAEKQPFSFDYRLWHVDGQYRWCHDCGRPQFGPAGELAGYVGSITDIHERKMAEEALRAADQRKNEFLATLAHELRNPLAPIRNSLHVLGISTADDPATRRITEMLERQGNYMSRLVDDLLDVARITSGKIELRTEQVEIAAIVRGAVEVSKPLIDTAEVRLATTLPSQPVTVEGDPVRLTQIVGNLLNNAAKYSEPGGQIWLTVTCENNQAIISVRDTGIGIEPQMLPRIFQMFSQADHEARRAQGGLGIGLALAKRLVEMHGGRIEGKSPGRGQGSEFIIRLPLAERQLPAPAAAAPLSVRDQLPRLASRVLIVDDNRDAANSLGMLLKMLATTCKRQTTASRRWS